MTVNVRVGQGFDIHPWSDDPHRPLVLGGVTVPGERGLAGHSDADVVAHAVADALLGAAGLPDLGTLFPAADPHYENADSMILLADVAGRLKGAGYRVGNVDVVIVAEQPRLAAAVGEMADNLQRVVGGSVSVKPKRGEGLGAIGRAEGIAAMAVALLEPIER